MRPSAFFSVEKIEVFLAILTINIQFINKLSNQMSIQRCNYCVQRSRHASYTGFLNNLMFNDAEPEEVVSPSINIVTPPRTPERMVRADTMYTTPSTRNRTPVAPFPPVDSSTTQRALHFTPTILFPLNDEEMPTRTFRQLPDPVAQPFESDACSICMEALQPTDLFVTRCGHQFHGTCMLNHITSSNTNNHCPSCRGHILWISLFPFFSSQYLPSILFKHKMLTIKRIGYNPSFLFA